MSFIGVERRRHPRYPYSDNLKFSSRTVALKKTYHGLSVDISSSGMCLYAFFKPLNPGDDIAFEDILPVAYRRATVRWVEKYSEDFYGVGLMFF